MTLVNRVSDAPLPAIDQPVTEDHPPRVVIENTRRVPLLPAGAVSRPRLLTRLVRSQRTPLVLMVAPAGWGKTTLLTQWAHVERRPVAWLTIEPRHNNPIVLRADVARLLDGVTEGPRRPDTVLVLDDVHLLQEPDALDLVGNVANHVAPGSQVVLSGRVTPWLRLGRRRVNRQLHEIGPAELAMNATEAGALLAAAGVLVPEMEIAELVALTEGWAAGLFLAALAHRGRRDLRRSITTLRGNDRAVAAYFREEILVDLDEDTLRFLTRTCILDRLSGPLCDAVLDEAGSGRQLEAIIEAGNLFLVPLDRDQHHYRYHRLFAELLLLELRSREPEVELELHERAAAWFESEGDVEQAVFHSRAAQALDRAGDLLLHNVLELVGTARQEVLGRSLDTFSPREVAGDAALSLSAAWHQIGSGDVRLVQQWLGHAESALESRSRDDGGQLAYALHLTAAWIGLEHGDAATTFETPATRHGTANQWWSLACLVEGTARLVAGRDGASELLRRAERSASSTPIVHVLALAYLALAASDQGDWAEAARLTDQAGFEVDVAGLDAFPPTAIAFAVFARVHAFHGDREEATRELEHAHRLLAGLGDLDPTTAGLTGLVIAHAQQVCGDRAASRGTLLRTEQRLSRLALSRQAGLRERLARQRTELEAATPSGIDGRTLTPAERRVLEFLPTHLTMAEIAQRLYVSRNTVKSQAIAIYQKLGASSRGQAVERARQFGLLTD